MSWTDKNPSAKKTSANTKPSTALFLQGGGALGAYQGGAYTAMAEAGMEPDWVSGISIGAINAAIIAGNPPEKRADKMKQFWNAIGTNYSDPLTTGLHGVPKFFAPQSHAAENAFMDAMHVPGFLRPVEANSSLYTPQEMHETLKKYVDFDYLNSESPTRISVGAVNISNGELVYFDSRKNISVEEAMQSRAKGSIMRNPQEVKKSTISTDHIMASGALIPSFPTVEIDGQHYCDGGLVSNTPVRMAYETGQLNKDMLVVRADLWSRDGKVPKTVSDASALAKAIQFSSPPIDLSGKVAGHIHTVLSNPDRLRYNMDFDFSHHAIKENWEMGYKDMQRAIEAYKKERATQSRGTIDTGNGHTASSNGHGR